jgi:two-component system, chemotaxis family, protein-glutamate methylesterase/glutaminase
VTVPAVRVLVVDASDPLRALLEGVVRDDPLLEIAGSAATAEQAVELVARRHPQVILLGRIEPLAAAVACVEHIMQNRPVPVVAIAGGPRDAREKRAFALMEAGAIAVVREPVHGPQSDAAEQAAALRQTLRLMAEVKVVRRWPNSPRVAAGGARPPPGPILSSAAGARQIDIVAIGASTGGPLALKEVLCRLPADFPVPVLVVQHISQGFVAGLARWLTESCNIRCAVASRGVSPQAGCAYLAPDGMHMRLAGNGTLELDDANAEHGHRPAVSRLFQSVTEHCGARAIGILLTGMGKDGAAELKLLKDAGGVTIAQDAASSVVHGMPGEAIRCGGATYIMSPQEIAAALPTMVAR